MVRRWLVEDLEPGCMLCGLSDEEDETVRQDLFGFWWCEQHRYRSTFLAWGQRHDWPQLRVPGESCAIGPGLWQWVAVALWGNDTFTWLLVAYSEYLDRAAKEGTTLKKGA